MKSTLILFFAIVALFFNGPLSAQSKKELQLENEMLRLSNAVLQLRLDSCELAGRELFEQLEPKIVEADELTQKISAYEVEILSRIDTSEKDADAVDRAVAWNDTIVHDQKKMLDLESDFIDAIVDGKDISDIENSFKIYAAFLYTLAKKYKDIAPFDETDTFRKAMIELVNEFKSVADNEYKEMIKIYSKDAEALTDADFDRWGVLTDIVDEKEGVANELFLLRQKIFTVEYHFTLQN